MFFLWFVVACHQPPQVSRRFDSRKFVVRFSAHKRAGDTFDFSRLSEIKTSPIEVFSKRKVKSILDGNSDVGKKRRRVVQTAKASDLDEVKAKYGKMFHDIRAVLERQVIAYIVQFMHAYMYTN